MTPLALSLAAWVIALGIVALFIGSACREAKEVKCFLLSQGFEVSFRTSINVEIEDGAASVVLSPSVHEFASRLHREFREKYEGKPLPEPKLFFYHGLRTLSSGGWTNYRQGTPIGVVRVRGLGGRTVAVFSRRIDWWAIPKFALLISPSIAIHPLNGLFLLLVPLPIFLGHDAISSFLLAGYRSVAGQHADCGLRQHVKGG